MRVSYKINRTTNLAEATLDACREWQKSNPTKCESCPLGVLCQNSPSVADLGNKISKFFGVLDNE